MENRTVVTEKKILPAKGWVPLMGFVLLLIGAILAVVGGTRVTMHYQSKAKRAA